MNSDQVAPPILVMSVFARMTTMTLRKGELKGCSVREFSVELEIYSQSVLLVFKQIIFVMYM